jgi:hypothetical protein
MAYHAVIGKVKVLTPYLGQIHPIYQVLSAKSLPCKTLLA